MRLLERLVLLRAIDSLWVEHLTGMDEMREGIGLQAYGQIDPLVAYKREAFAMFEQLMANIRNMLARSIYHVELMRQPPPAPTVAGANGAAGNGDGDGDAAPAAGQAGPRNLRTNREPVAVAATGKQKVGRNDPCPCGSGKKYKKCHGAV